MAEVVEPTKELPGGSIARPKLKEISPYLFLSSIESYYLFEHLRGWPYDIYLEFDFTLNKLKQVHVSGKRTEDRMKQLGLDYTGMFKLDAKKGAELYSVISQNRASSYGTEIQCDLDRKDHVISNVHPKAVRGFDF